jgi:hypothetical protein
MTTIAKIPTVEVSIEARRVWACWMVISGALLSTTS